MQRPQDLEDPAARIRLSHPKPPLSGQRGSPAPRWASCWPFWTAPVPRDFHDALLKTPESRAADSLQRMVNRLALATVRMARQRGHLRGLNGHVGIDTTSIPVTAQHDSPWRGAVSVEITAGRHAKGGTGEDLRPQRHSGHRHPPPRRQRRPTPGVPAAVPGLRARHPHRPHRFQRGQRPHPADRTRPARRHPGRRPRHRRRTRREDRGAREPYHFMLKQGPDACGATASSARPPTRFPLGQLRPPRPSAAPHPRHDAYPDRRPQHPRVRTAHTAARPTIQIPDAEAAAWRLAGYRQDIMLTIANLIVLETRLTERDGADELTTADLDVGDPLPAPADPDMTHAQPTGLPPPPHAR